MLTDVMVRAEPLIDRPVVKINNERFEIWKDLNIRLDSEAKTATFSFQVGPVEHGGQQWGDLFGALELADALGLNPDAVLENGKYPGSLVVVEFGGEPFLTGIVDSQTFDTTGTSESLSISGRCNLSLLKDSCVPLGLASLNNQPQEITGAVDAQERIRALAEEIVNAFTFKDGTHAFTAEVDVMLPDTTSTATLGKSLPKVIPRPKNGERCYTYLVRMTKLFNYSDIWVTGAGQLVIGSLQQRRMEIRRGLEHMPRLYCFRDSALASYNNVTSARVTYSIQNAYSDTSAVTNTSPGNSRVRKSEKADAKDRLMPIKKMKCIYDSDIRNEKGAALMAVSDRDVGRTNKFTFDGTVAGYGQMIEGAPLYLRTNQPVHLVHEAAGINWGGGTPQEYYISNLSYTCNVSGGPKTTFSLRREIKPMNADGSFASGSFLSIV
jgi:prophage tail gpP-like protein